MWWIILLSCLMCVIIYFLFASFFIEIDSYAGICRVRFQRLVSAGITMNEGSLFFYLEIAGWRKNIDLLKPGKKKYGPDELLEKILTPTSKEKEVHRDLWKMWRKGIGAIKSFRLRRCSVQIDTGDMCLNGILYPLFYFLTGYSGKTVMINFKGENEIILQLENSIARLLWAYIKS
jgi:hypothetical protein